MTLKELLDGYKAGTITYDRAERWNNNNFKKALEKAKKDLAENGDDDPEKVALKDKISELQEQVQNVSADSKEAKLAKNIIADLEKQLSDKEAIAKNEIEKIKKDSESYKAKYINEFSKSALTETLRKMKVNNPELAADYIVDKKVANFEEVRDKDGNLQDIKIKLNFSYVDDKTGQNVPGIFEGNKSDTSKLEDGFRILSNSDKTSFTNFKALFPVMETVNIGSGARNVNTQTSMNNQQPKSASEAISSAFDGI
ncbi:MAG: hypothetical protein A2015_10735 [Spirochaetes bacterium GWF1_31_7]|nr:MAG: hypothetical protein A2015_10735 [Spirochaetes bacterium GWF1_31_7]OHD74046.1 MAG: hypothetical protein A2355_08725 [Spirochaetes bacterium RIFOXYB1_FULL_32_8]HBD93519.1 hypothetical protein [Spirochaetia bacterium]HBI37042.1 hypothetical protein [Spirochaetia bacterium]